MINLRHTLINTLHQNRSGELRNKVKQKISEAKQKSWKDFSNEIIYQLGNLGTQYNDEREKKVITAIYSSMLLYKIVICGCLFAFN